MGLFETLVGYRRIFGNENYQIILNAIRDNKEDAKKHFLALVMDKYPFINVDLSTEWDKLSQFEFGDDPEEEFTKFIKELVNINDNQVEVTPEQETIIQHMDNPNITQDTDKDTLIKLGVAYLGAFNEVSSAIAQGILEGTISEDVIKMMEEALPILTKAVEQLKTSKG